MEDKQNDKQKKIIIDEDWKQQARREKEVLSAQEESEKKPTPPQDKRSRGPLPQGNFAALVSMLVTQSLFALGVLEVEGQRREPDLDMAKYNIDMLETLEAKTKGNLTDQEQKVLEDTLSQVRMAYVKVAG